MVAVSRESGRLNHTSYDYDHSFWAFAQHLGFLDNIRGFWESHIWASVFTVVTHWFRELTSENVDVSVLESVPIFKRELHGKIRPRQLVDVLARTTENVSGSVD